MSRPRRIINCQPCGRRRPHCARDLCNACYQRWRYYGKPESGPPPVTTSVTPESRVGRMEDYVWLRSLDESREAAAARLGVTERTIWRYERALREVAS